MSCLRLGPLFICQTFGQTHAHLLQRPPAPLSGLALCCSLGRVYKRERTHTHTHTEDAFICASLVMVSLRLAGKQDCAELSVTRVRRPLVIFGSLGLPSLCVPPAKSGLMASPSQLCFFFNISPGFIYLFSLSEILCSPGSFYFNKPHLLLLRPNCVCIGMPSSFTPKRTL